MRFSFKEQEFARGFLADHEITFQQFSRSEIVRHRVMGRIVEAYERYRV